MNEHNPVNLTNCDVEPIHIPGSIQPHGCLIACNVAATAIVRHSINCQSTLGLEGDLNGLELATILGHSLEHDIRNALARTPEGTRSALMFNKALPNGRRFDIAVHRFKGNAIIEFEPAGDDVAKPLEIARAMLTRIGSLNSIDRLTRDTARLVQGMLGYDRVMIYQFGPDGAGKVISEAKRADLESFLGQYFPATDIPVQARALYLKNTIRIISDANFERIRISPQFDASGEPLDLSFAHLRSVSPIHCEYLRNMGVGASMSISVIVDGQLWGLIACHHYSPRTLSMAQRVAAEMFGDFFSLHLTAMRHKQSLDAATAARDSLDDLLQAAIRVEDINVLLRERLGDFGKLIKADGLAMWLDGQLTLSGTTPPAEAIPTLARFAETVAEGRIWASHKLSDVVAGAEHYATIASGMLALPLSQRPRDYVFLFRKEVVQTLDWAGNPEKTYESGPLGDRLTPRKSFAIWKETVHHQSSPWTEQEREFAEAARSALVGVILQHSELLADERAKAEVRQRMLNEELNHRVKNILAVIKSLVTNPVEQDQSLEDYVESLRGRIQALSLAHDQVIRGEGGGGLQDLLEAELLPYRNGTTSITLSGANVWMDARSFSIMALVLHELSTNAAKYGALSRPGGKLAVSWTVDAVGACELNWVESDGPIVTPPSRRGFGTVLIDRSLPFDLGGESDVQYLPSGVVALLRIPPRFISLRNARPETKAATPTLQLAKSGISLAGKRALIVEDQMLIALDLEQILEDAGLSVVATVTSPPEALAYLAKDLPDVAILDINLGDGNSESIAQALQARSVPFMFATGYGDGGIGAEFASVPVVRKPYSREAIVAELKRLLG
ncbi:Bacteriophytochrome (light-regulated signal transduction histidine kinase) [Devosia sp. YR412]|uniref:HWE histidine kinase domain-containing protein n=1 Tax=Devosia sp. YR412 TaxID=1881030 RepID=UPI0008C74B69|nr:HWE histidine kinase domain-containing protein [Devosia sp. YR412]SEQ02670.1 Bacteriophytochrome (light-regulated signal transduction histidine kinase) [Devosia sp. YR412]